MLFQDLGNNLSVKRKNTSHDILLKTKTSIIEPLLEGKKEGCKFVKVFVEPRRNSLLNKTELNRGTRLEKGPAEYFTGTRIILKGYFLHMVASICVTVGDTIIIFRRYIGFFSMGLLAK